MQTMMTWDPKFDDQVFRAEIKEHTSPGVQQQTESEYRVHSMWSDLTLGRSEAQNIESEYRAHPISILI